MRWRQAVASSAFPATERAIRGTLLCLVDLMTSTGELMVWRDELIDVTGLPARTIDRHLARAVAAGWLTHETQGGKRRRAVYRATIPGDPDDRSVRHSRRAERQFCAPSTRRPTPQFCAPPSGAHQEESTSVSEHGAVDDHRDRRTDHDGSRVSRLHVVRSKDGSNDEMTAELVPSSPARPSLRPLGPPAGWAV